MSFFTIKDQNSLILSIKLTPNAKKTSIIGVSCDDKYGHFIKISVTTIPEKGKANKDLIAFLSKTLKIAKSNFEIISGMTDRYKKIMIIGDVEYIEEKLKRLK